MSAKRKTSVAVEPWANSYRCGKWIDAALVNAVWNAIAGECFAEKVCQACFKSKFNCFGKVEQETTFKPDGVVAIVAKGKREHARSVTSVTGADDKACF